ncbi:hypothetical protein [Bradyrhizobium sp. WD16]|uniref:hypothetical protein n=1 Tax=Bradyrhizobium sp. WD16 TaxID=1521768 RepID=UPI0020A2C5CD|nr:hypothetical protein [Bradyrhizobium sp. WD16]UTD28465.1 hypothetical protein DB459_17740 [Bradyrhizobium sp. WD16]
MTTAHPAPPPAAASPTEARQLSNGLMEVMTELLGIIENETALVRAGKLRDAMALSARKTELSRRYASLIGSLKISQTYFSRAAPDLMKALHSHHDTFRAMLQVNLTVLATAHAVSEGIIRGVNVEMQRKNMPQTYTAAGRNAAPNARHAAPISVSRSL